MKRVALGFVVLLAAAFLFVAVTKRRAPDGSSDQARSTLGDDERLRIQEFWDRYRDATNLRIAGKIADAARAYTQALELNPDHEDALYYLGNMQFELGESAEAERAWLRLIEVNDLSARTHSRLGDLHFCLQDTEYLDLDRAAREYERSLEIYKEETGPLLRLGQIALMRGDLEDAREHLQAVTGSNYSSIEAHFLSGYVSWKAGDSTGAMRSLSQAVEYARPDETAETGLSEGDTKAGAAPLLAASRRCQRFENHLQDLADVDEADLAREMNDRYHRLDAFLSQVRPSVTP